MIVSFLPPKLLKIVNFLGFKGVRDVAFTELNAVAYELPGIYSLIGELLELMSHQKLSQLGRQTLCQCYLKSTKKEFVKLLLNLTQTRLVSRRYDLI